MRDRLRLLNSIGHLAQYSYGTAWIEIQNLASECDKCPYMNTDEEIEILKSDGVEALVDHLLFYLVGGRL